MQFISGGLVDLFYDWVRGNGLAYQLCMSLFSAMIFYLVFTTWPNYWKRRKLRPIVVFDLFSVQTKIYAILNIVMISSKTTALGPYADKIFSGGLSRNDILMGLQNKCLTVRDLYDKNVPYPLIPIGQLLDYHTKDTERLIDKVFNLSQFANANEILLVEKIRNHLNEFGLSVGANEKELATSNCPWLVEAYWPLYQCFLELQALLISQESNHPDFISGQYDFHFASGNYKVAKKIATKQIKNISRGKFHYECALVECNYKLGNTAAFRSGLKDIYTHPMRGLPPSKHMTMFNKDPEAQKILIAAAGSEMQFRRLQAESMRPAITMAIFEEEARALSKYFASLDPGYVQVDERPAAGT